MLDVAGKYPQPEQCDWALTSSQSSVSSGGGGGGGGDKQEQSSSSPQHSVDNSSSIVKEHDYIGMNEVSSSFKGRAASESNVNHHLFNLQETELRLGPLKNSSSSSPGDVRNGASFQPKSQSGSAGSVYSKSSSGGDESPARKVLDLGMGLARQNAGDADRKPSEITLRSLASQKENGSPFVQEAVRSSAASSKGGVAGAKRVFAEAIGGEGASFPEGRSGFAMLTKLNSEIPFTQLSKHPLLPPLYPWKAAKQQYLSHKLGKVDDPSWSKEVPKDDSDEVDASSTRAPVGWPPVQSFRKTTLAVPQSPKKQPENQKPVVVSAASSAAQNNDSGSPYVKVYMDGVSIGRKVEVKSANSYEKLVAMLEEMFQHHINGQNAASSPPVENQKLNFLAGSDFVLTYEDKDGDLMLVGDVPWKMFTGTVKRLRIMKGTDAIGLAPRSSPE